jgi:peptidoglycan/xylan/chitin deacetylase (PgdA/CDA1 family)
VESHGLRLLLIFQLVITLVFLWAFLHFQQQFKSLSGPAASQQHRENEYFDRLKDLLASDNFNFTETSVRSEGVVPDHSHLLELVLKKDWVVNIWRNDQPATTQVIIKDGLISIPTPLQYGRNDIRILALDQKQRVVFKDQLSVEYHNARVELLRHSIERGRNDTKNIAITFDAGSDDSNTHQILGVLQNCNLHCTLFLTGKFMEKYPELVKEMVAAGHEIANHTYSHPRLTTYSQNSQHDLLPGITRDYLQTQLQKTDSVFFTISGSHLKPYWRAPFGEYNNDILTWAAEAGYLHIYWTGSFDTHDWVADESSSLYQTPVEIYDSIMTEEKASLHGLNGVIILMHLGSQRNGNHIYQMLPRLIKSMRDRGYDTVNITQLLNS